MDAKEYADRLMAPESDLRKNTKVSGTAASSSGKTSAEQPAEDDGPYEQAMKQAQEKAMEIESEYSGIDADQGYKLAAWGFPREMVLLILSKQSEFPSLKRYPSMDTFFPGGTDKLELVYLNNALYRTVLHKGVCSREDFSRYCAELIGKYGATQSGESDIVAAVLDGSLKVKSIKEQGKVYSVTWAGKITTGTLTFLYADGNKDFQDVVFTKEYVPKK